MNGGPSLEPVERLHGTKNVIRKDTRETEENFIVVTYPRRAIMLGLKPRIHGGPY